MTYIKDPSSIEETSFKIIQSVIDQEHPDYHFETEMQESIIKRAIHTTGDFDYLYNLRFTKHAIENIQSVLREGGTLLVDSIVSLNGINKRVLDQMGVRYRCIVQEEEVIQLAKKRGIARTMAAVEIAKKIKGPKVYAFSDDSIALSYLVEQVEAGELDVNAVIGVPVGFINVIEAKEKLLHSKIPAILSTGYKGGSTIIVAIINAIIYQLREVETEDYTRYSTPSRVKKGL